MKDILTAPIVAELIRTITNMYQHGWDERNGGGFTSELPAHLPCLATISDEGLRQLAAHFGVRAREGYLA